jgi:hypothetical protein
VKPVPSPEASPVRPLLSVVLTGRNDGYGVDFRDRFFRTLRFNAAQLTASGIDHEFVFVEWAPPADAPRLVDLVFEAIPELDRATCRWLLVDPQYQDALSQSPALRYLEYIAKNVGIRRANGRFVLATNCDIYLGRRVLAAIASGSLAPRTLYRAPRHDLKLAADQSNVDFDLLEDERNLEGPPRRLKPPYMAGGTGDFILLDRDTFHQLRGFNEIYRAVRVGIDRNFVVKALSSGVPLADIGGPVYHVNHVGTLRFTKHLSEHARGDATSVTERWNPNGVIYQNPPSWGLADAPIRACGDGCWELAFAWSAVPPLVDLRGVAIPMSRGGAVHVGASTPGEDTTDSHG